MNRNPTTREVAEILTTLCDLETVAALLNALLCCEAEPRLSDREVEIGERLFDQLVELCPQAVELAQQS